MMCLLKDKTAMSWSGGKDSALALHKLKLSKQSPSVLFTTINSKNNRVSMHGTPISLIKSQANCLGLELKSLLLPPSLNMNSYNLIMEKTLLNMKNEGFTSFAFGDIFLEDIKTYRISQLNKIGINAKFPLWGKSTKLVMDEFLDKGFKTVITSLNENKLPIDFIGRVIDKDLLKTFPKNIDICGENGEYHSFVFDGPIFKKPVPYKFFGKVKKTYTNPENGELINYWFANIY